MMKYNYFTAYSAITKIQKRAVQQLFTFQTSKTQSI